MNIIQNQNVVTGILGLLLIASVIGDIFLYQKIEKNEPLYAAQRTGTSTVTIFEGPGFKNEVVTLFDGKQYRTYATSSPLSESGIRTMREKMEGEIERMNDFFKKQDELFRSLWNL
ncbi:hypothetical protein C4568_01695 [Candidatus Parcubacteria bacterium]|nr:MAG: hypothetical protein C4568_01695 [Candidatus Parcubacteria bacterium]